MLHNWITRWEIICLQERNLVQNFIIFSRLIVQNSRSICFNHKILIIRSMKKNVFCIALYHRCNKCKQTHRTYMASINAFWKTTVLLVGTAYSKVESRWTNFFVIARTFVTYFLVSIFMECYVIVGTLNVAS
jgi:hypothetical protein